MKHLTAVVIAFVFAVSATSTFAESPRQNRGASQSECPNCPPARKYDTQEVIQNTREVDHSRAIETQSMVPSKRVIETNHLVVHENVTRHVGTVQHNHTIIEKELVLTKRNVDHRTVNRVINLVEHKYNVVRRKVVEYREIPGEIRYFGDCCERRRPRASRLYGKYPGYVAPWD
jgi:hypothetical protein